MVATDAPEIGMQVSAFSTGSEPRTVYQNYLYLSNIAWKSKMQEIPKSGI